MAEADCSWFESYLAPKPGERLVEVERMRALEQDCVPLLCSYLRDPRLRVRTIAAWTLAEVGDERAVGPLCEALEWADRGYSPWARWLMTCIGLICMAVATLAAVFSVLLLTRFWLHADGGDSFSSAWGGNRASLRGHEVFVTALITALDHIIERHPAPAARQALGPLNRLSDDGIRHQRDTREQARRTAHRIHLSTLNCHRLPMPSAAAAVPVEELPLPAGTA